VNPGSEPIITVIIMNARWLPSKADFYQEGFGLMLVHVEVELRLEAMSKPHDEGE
jgi:hypothetical protein